MTFVCILVAVALQPSPAMLRQLFEEQLARQEAAYGETDPRTAQAARDLGQFLIRQGETAGAREALARAVRADEKTFGPAAALTLSDVADLASSSDPRSAEPLWQRASRSSDPLVAVRSLSALGALREQAGDREGAARYYRQALKAEESASGKDSTRIAARLNALSLVLEPEDGLPLLERALKMTTARTGARSIETASIELNLAVRLMGMGRGAEAVKAARDATSIFEQVLGAEHPRTVTSRQVLERALVCCRR